jgi:hypothetical protein
VGLDDGALSSPLITLMADLEAASPSFRGLHLTIEDIVHPVSLTAFLPLHDGDSINTSLRVRLAALGSGIDGESRVVFYAATPGAFVDLAADFGYVLGSPVSAGSPTPRDVERTDGDGQGIPEQADGERQHGPGRSAGEPLIVLDGDLPPFTTQSGLAGLAERSTIDRAIGMMLDRGHHPDSAHAALRRHAAAAGVEPHVYAAQLLRD